MVLVTGASGKTGRAIVAQLAKRDVAVRAWVRRQSIALEGASELFIGDMQDAEDWSRACVNIKKIYHICPNMHPEEVNIGRLAIQSAKQAGVEHFVYHSVLHPQTREMAHHWHKLLVEEMILASGLPFTILQPAPYMQNLQPQWETIKNEGVLRLPYSINSAISLVDLNDVAEAAVTVIGSNQYIFGTFELTGTPPLTQQEVLNILGATINRTIQFEEIALDNWEANNKTLSDFARQTLLAMFRYYDQFGLAGNSISLRSILGRTPTSLANFFSTTNHQSMC